jgi:hypothetical protein
MTSWHADSITGTTMEPLCPAEFSRAVFDIAERRGRFRAISDAHLPRMTFDFGIRMLRRALTDYDWGPGAPCSIPGLCKQGSTPPDITERELLDIFRSPEFRSPRSPIDQLQFLRTNPHKFTFQIVAVLLNEPGTTVHTALKRLRFLKEAAGRKS